MSRLDDIKRKLNLDNLDESERKKLFKEFIEHGGDPNYIEKKEPTVKQSKYKNISRYAKARSYQQDKDKSSGQTTSVSKKDTIKEGKKITREQLIKSIKPSFLESFYIKLVAYLNKVTNFNGFFMNLKFISITTTNLLEAVNDLETIAKIILSSKSFNEFEIKDYFFKKFPIYYEILLRLNKTNLKEIIQSISEKEKTSPSFKLAISEIEREISNLFRTLYIFWPFKNSIPEAYREGFRILEKRESLPSNIINTYITKIRRGVDFIFNKYLIKIYYAFLISQNVNIKISDPNISVLLQLSLKDKIGGMQQEIEEQLNREKEEMKVEEEVKEEKEDIINVEESINLPKEVLTGIEIIESIPLHSFGDSKNSPFYFYDKKDKIYRVSAIIDFFEKEYSFLITGNKVNYYPEHHEGLRFDPKRDFNESYVEMNSVLDSIREYSNIIKSINETEENPNIPVMQKHSLIHKASIERSKLSMSIRAKLANVVIKIKNTLEKIRTNYNKFVADPDKELTFSSGLEKSKKRLEGKKISEALEEFYFFISGFHYLLTKGNLGGAGNIIRQDK
ncbi:MAG TPA: hypothetical protein PKW55_07005 [Spirochaetota bacterium]|nr:hypothetical protein [Spirochaetota bacterium]HOM38736.1 hypothetical protein [Spirochaetota bacterium]HPQ49534.1 hypothetical protein [Spirochaetota bacterium]